MNRKLRRASNKQAPTPGVEPALNALAATADLYRRAAQHANLGELNTAAAIYKRALAIQPSHEPSHEGLAQVYLSQGKLAKASAQYVELARVLPQTLNDFAKVLRTLKRLVPTLEACLANSATASIETLSERGVVEAHDDSSIAANPYFRVVLESTTVRDIVLERWLTALRGAMLRATLADEPLASDDILAFASALAQQCFINEYVFAVSPTEAEQVQRLKTRLTEASERGTPLDAMLLLVCAMYMGLHSLPNVSALASRTWPGRVAAVLTQQVHEPKLEQGLRASMPRLTPISDGVTAEVREQ
jgi:tetratricopeptide (TPR) repeat protein